LRARCAHPRAKSQHVSAVYCDGELIYADGRFTKVDRDEVFKEIHDILAKPRTAEEMDRRELGLAVFPHVKRFYTGLPP
jgi:5-methylthioadenosine/S-adenosylhomocysteine deaminase